MHAGSLSHCHDLLGHWENGVTANVIRSVCAFKTNQNVCYGNGFFSVQKIIKYDIVVIIIKVAVSN